MTTAEIEILYHHRTQGRGAEGSHIRGMVDGFRGRGCGVDIIGPPGVDPYDPGTVKSGRAPSGVQSALSAFAAHAPEGLFELAERAYNLPAGRRLRRAVRRKPYRFIYERYALNSWACSVVAEASGLPLVLEVNDATVIERSRPLWFKRAARRQERAVFSRARRIVTITNHFKELIVEQHAVPAERVLVLPNAIDPGKFELTGRVRLARAGLGIPESSIVLGCVGAFVPWHGLQFLVESLGESATLRDLFFLFIGDGPVRNDVLAAARRAGAGDRVRFTGFLAPEQVPLHLDLVDLCVIPGSNAHCSPMKLFEYMAMAKPVVLPRYKPLLETVAHERDALFFDPGDGAGLRRELVRLIESPDLRQELGRRAREAVAGKFTWDRNAARVLEALQL